MKADSSHDSGQPLLQRLSPMTASSTFSGDASAAEMGAASPTERTANSRGAAKCDEVHSAVVRCHYHRVVLGSMTLTGLFFPRHFDGLCVERWKRPLLLYSTLILALMTFNTGRVIFTSFDRSDYFSDVLFHKVDVACWLTVCTVNYAIHYGMSFSKNGLRRYYVKTVSVRRAFAERGIVGCHDSAARIEIACLTIGWFLVLANTAYVLYGIITPKSVLFPTDSGFRLWQPLSNETESDSAAAAAATLAMRVIYGVTVFYYSAAWIWPVVYFIDVSMHANHLFSDFNKHLRATARRGCLLSSIDVYRQLHRKACTLLTIANNYFKYLLGTNMLFYLVLSMVQLYSVLWSPSMHDPAKIDLLVAFIVWLSASVLILALECVAASVTSTRARECLEILLKLNEKREEIGNKELLETQLFMAKLSSSIGYTSMDMFVVSKEVTLTVCGAWLTYFLLIVQFRPPT